MGRAWMEWRSWQRRSIWPLSTGRLLLTLSPSPCTNTIISRNVWRPTKNTRRPYSKMVLHIVASVIKQSSKPRSELFTTLANLRLTLAHVVLCRALSPMSEPPRAKPISFGLTLLASARQSSRMLSTGLSRRKSPRRTLFSWKGMGILRTILPM